MVRAGFALSLHCSRTYHGLGTPAAAGLARRNCLGCTSRHNWPHDGFTDFRDESVNYAAVYSYKATTGESTAEFYSRCPSYRESLGVQRESGDCGAGCVR